MENFCQRGNLSKRTISELRPVLADKSISGSNIAYEMCRAEKQNGRLRYDITLLYSKPFGKELAKTYGHYHKNNKPEFYEIISGEIIFLMQKHETSPEEITEAYLIRAGQGQKFIIPPKFAMASINPSITKNVIMANWIDNEEKNDYAPIEKLKGFCYYLYTPKTPNKDFETRPNANYKQIPPLIELMPKPIPAELEDLNFLIEPEKYENILTIEKLYEKIH